MRALRGVAVLAVAFAGEQQGIRQRNLVAAPAGCERQCRQAKRGGNGRCDRDQAFLQPLKVLQAPRGEGFARFGQFVIPSIQHLRLCALFE